MPGTILSLCAFDVLPARSGDALRTSAINGGLAAQGWHVRQYLAFPSISRNLRNGGAASRPLGPCWDEHRATPGTLKLAAWLFNRLGLPPLAADWAPPGLLAGPSLRTLLKQADLVIAEHPWLFRAARRAVPGAKTLWVQDAHNIEYPIYAARGGGWLSQVALARLRDLERYAFRNADINLVVCADDADSARQFYGAREDSLVLAPNGVDCRILTPVNEARRQARKQALGLGPGPVALFAGADWPPNREAAGEIVRIARQLIAERSDRPFEFVIVGSVGVSLPRDQLPAGVRITGPVDEIRPWLEAADLALNPMCSGGGSNIKLLEYLACALPVISTPFGARGLGLEPGRHLTVVPLEDFTRELRAASGSAAKAALAAMGLAGRREVQARFDWSSIAASVSGVFERALCRD